MIDLCAIRKLQTSLRTFEKQLKEETGLSFNDALLLCAVNKGVQEPGLLAKELELSPSRLTRILDSLESRDLTERDLSPIDRRSMLVTLTHKGKQRGEQCSCSGITLPTDLQFSRV